MKHLGVRLVLATLIPTVLITITLAPFVWSNIQNRLDHARTSAQAQLEAEYGVLLQDMNESINHALAVAEFPNIEHYLQSAQQTHSPYQEGQLKQNREQLDDMFKTLLTHFGRYTRLALIGKDGDEHFSTQHSGARTTKRNHSETRYFMEAMTLEPRSLYVSPPHLAPGIAGPEITTGVMDIATPVFGRDGQRLRVLLLTLDWGSLADRFLRAIDAQSGAVALLVDANGSWLLPTETSAMPFGGLLQTRWPDAWQAMQVANRGSASVGDNLLFFRTHDIRTHHFRSQAEQVFGLQNSQPWRLGLITPRPGLASLLAESPWKGALVILVYGLAIAFGLGWVLTNHRQRTLKAEAQQLSAEARDYARELADLYENAPCGYHSLNEDGVIMKMNRTEQQWLGRRADELVGQQKYRELVTPETRAAFDKAFQEVLRDGHEGSAECELICQDGSTLPVAIEATARTNTDGFQYSRAMVFDLTERKQLEDLLTRQAMTDPLTELGNRRYLENQAAMEMAKARRNGMPLCLLAIDLDRFKNINDLYGHDVGDMVLQAFARTAKAHLREGDVLCRMGGEEFSILLPDTNPVKAEAIAERLRLSIEAATVTIGEDLIDGGNLTYTASFGVTEVKPDETSLKPAIKRADQGLYEAKETGRNCIVVA